MDTDPFPVQWTEKQAVVTLPEHIDTTTAGQLREQLLGLVNRGATVLVADMTATVSCDHAGADALIRAHHRASVNGAQLRVAVTSPLVRRILDVTGLNRVISTYPSLEAALAPVYSAIKRIRFDGMHFRKDIGASHSKLTAAGD